MKKINSNMTITEVLNFAGEKAIPILLESGMHCFGCPMAQRETLEQGCLAHGFSKKEIKELIERLNSIDSKTETLK